MHTSAVEENQHKTSFYTSVGEIIGYRDHNVIRVTGIPYAATTRFQLPKPIKTLDQPFLGTRWSPACPQTDSQFLNDLLGHDPMEHLTYQENCQHLSITLPAHSDTLSKLPVMVWIHGGSYTSGAGDAMLFDPLPLVEEQQVIVVSINYRLGLLGFLGGYAQKPANLGLLDMIEALKWVHHNISAFGGDTANITLFGQSAGGDAIAHLMIADGTEHLFNKVIIQSAPFGIIRKRADMYAGMQQVAQSIVDNEPVHTMINKQKDVSKAAKGFGFKSAMPFGVQYGQYPLPAEDDIDAIWKRRAAAYKVLVGYTQQETTLFIPAIKPISRIIAIPFLGHLLKRFLVYVSTRQVYVKESMKWARRMQKGGASVYTYKIKWGRHCNSFGATHTIDLALLFGNVDTWLKTELTRGITAKEIENDGQQTRALWAQFAWKGELARKGFIKNTLTFRRL